jgi:Flp pilus assembly protein CpaB
MKLNTYVSYNTITLELDPADVQKLAYIQAYGTGGLSLSLRNNTDKDVTRLKPTQIFDVLGEDSSEEKQYVADKYKEKPNGQ